MPLDADLAAAPPSGRATPGAAFCCPKRQHSSLKRLAFSCSKRNPQKDPEMVQQNARPSFGNSSVPQYMQTCVQDPQSVLLRAKVNTESLTGPVVPPVLNFSPWHVGNGSLRLQTVAKDPSGASKFTPSSPESSTKTPRPISKPCFVQFQIILLHLRLGTSNFWNICFDQTLAVCDHAPANGRVKQPADFISPQFAGSGHGSKSRTPSEHPTPHKKLV